MTTNDKAGRPASRSHLFTLRFWLEDLGGGQTAWRGKVQHVTTGEVHYFHDWKALETFVEELIYKDSGNDCIII